MEPVYAGAALEGANACVIVPNRRFVSFNFYIQKKLLPHDFSPRCPARAVAHLPVQKRAVRRVSSEETSDASVSFGHAVNIIASRRLT